MATAYAALTSVMNIIDTIQNHPRPPISLHPQQIQSLVETISFLQEFLEAGYTNQVFYDNEPDALEMRIADATHAAEDLIESHIMDNIIADGERVSSVDLYESLQKVIDDMEAVKKEALAVKEKMKGHQHRIRGEDSSSFAASSSFAGPEQFNAMVGFDDILIQVLDTLTSDESRRQIISLTGMGGMGKTTLARNVYQHLVEHFDIRAWVTVSQQYKVRNILLKLLEGSGENLSQVDEYELGTILHKTLVGRRYLIVLDDIWNIEIWDRLRLFLPDNNRSRILITTRLSNLAREIDDSHNIEMHILDEDNARELFCKHVFKEDDCPFELESIGKRIVEGCKGLPLSISVVGGLLGKSKWEKQYWEDIADNLNSTVNNKHCLQILYMSYYNLPVHLKPIFLFLGTVLDHEEFYPIFLFVQFLIAEGLVKPVRGKSLEETAVVCVSELVERNLISIDKTSNMDYWMFKKCRMHDLLRDLCLRESQNQKFIYFLGEQIVDTIPQNINSICRICVAKNTSKAVFLPFLESASLLRSLWCGSCGYSTSLSLPSIKSRLLRLVWANGMTDPEDAQKFNLRVIMRCDPDQLTSITLFRFWNLHMIWAIGAHSLDVIMAQHDMWNMSQLRSIWATSLCLPNPPGREDCGIILENLHMIVKICNFKCSEEVVKRIPRIKHLILHYTHVEGSYCLHNLGRLQQLEFLQIEVDTQTHIIKNQNLNITFPRSLISLYLSGSRLHWDEVTANIGPLPHLEVLQLHGDSCIGAKWETIEGQFCHLKILRIVECCDLENWTTESTHFPRLKILSLQDFDKLKEIPSSVGDIPTLEFILLGRCSDSANYSARSIKEEQEELGNEDLSVIIDGESI